MTAKADRVTLLLVEDNPANLLLAEATLRRAGYRTIAARTAEEALARLRSATPDAILMDVQLPGMDGLTLTRQLKADPVTAAIPIVALTAHAMAGDAAKAMAAGCDGYLTKPIDVVHFAEQVAAILDGIAGAPRLAPDAPAPVVPEDDVPPGEPPPDASDRPWILVVDDHAENINLVRAQLDRVGYAVTGAASGLAALDAAMEDPPPDLILLDVMMPGLDGYEVCRRLKQHPATRTIPVLMLTALQEQTDKARGLEAGADDFLSKPVDPAELVARVRSLVRQKLLVDAAARLQGELARQGEDLAIEKSRAEAILDSMGDGVVVTDRERRVVLVNAAAEALIGLALEDARGRGWPEVLGQEAAAAMTRGGAPDTIQRALASGSAAPAQEVVIRTPGGGAVAVAVAAAPIKNPDGMTVGAVAVLRDVSGQHNSRRRLATQYAVTAVLAEARSPSEALRGSLRAICEGLNWQVGILWWDYGGQLRCAEAWNSPSSDAGAFVDATRAYVIAPDSGLTAQVWGDARPYWAADLRAEPLFRRLESAEKAGLRCGLWVPIRVGPEVLGVLQLLGSDCGLVDDELRADVDAFGAQIGSFFVRRRGEDALRTSEELLHSVIANAPLVLFAVDRDGKFTLSDGKGLEALGLLPGQSVGQSVYDVYRDVPEVEVSIRRALGGDSSSATIQVGPHVFDTGFSPLRDASGAVIGVIGVATDVSERQVLSTLVARERATLVAVMASMREGLLVVDGEGAVVYCNANAAALLGVPVSAVGSRPIEALLDVLASRASNSLSVRASLGRALARTTDEAIELELPGPPPRDLRIDVFVIRDPEGVPDGAVMRGVVLRDVTAERDLTRAKDELMSVVSHELRTPLVSLVGFAELMLAREFPPEEQREFLTIMHQEGNRLTAMINDFLDLQRIESGHQTVNPTPSDPNALLVRAASAAGHEAERPIVVDASPDLPMVLADSDRIHQVLANLLSNARKFSPAGGVVRLAARMVSGAVELSVADQGLGIPTDALPQLFEKFFRVDNSDRREIKGTGLGLAICQKIVAAHGGSIAVESAGLGQGSRFAFTLRLADDGATGDVLVVEDDAGFARLLEVELVARGLSIVVVPTAELALERAIRAPRAIVLDLVLPALQGEALLPRLRELIGDAVPLVVVSVKDLTASEHADLVRDGAAAIIRKGPQAAAQAAEAVSAALTAALPRPSEAAGS